MLLGVFAFFVGLSALPAQSRKIRTHPAKPVVPTQLLQAVAAPVPMTGLEAQAATSQPSVPFSPSMLRAGLVEEIPGITRYDLQSNGSESARLHVWPNGEVSATWQYSNMADGSGWPDRGTAYNRRTDWMTGSQPTARIEATLRAGFPNYMVTEDGAELVVSHIVKTGGGYQLHTARRASGASTWTEADVPTIVPQGVLWSKAAVDGNTIHVIAISTIVGLAGQLYKGVDGHLLYSRSKDGGLTWDIVDRVIPGLDSSAYAQISADKYCIAARDGAVAVGIFDSWNDAQVFKSTDGGDNWGVPFLIWDFPLEKYTTDKGYTTADIGGADPDAPDTLAIFTTDGSASILLDVLGFVHLWVGETYVLDANLADGTANYYPGINGLIYWRELNPDDLFEITYSRDWNNNDTLDFVGVVGYGTGLSSMPASASDDNGNLYLAYSAGVENLNDFNDQNFRHVYTMKSPDFGTTWTDPVDVHYLAAAGQDSTIANLSEGVWPMACKTVTDKFHFIYQRDFTPGSSVQIQPTLEDGLSDMVYLAHSDIVGTKSPTVPALDFSVYPNPAREQLQVGFELPQAGLTSLELLDQTGRVAYRMAPVDLPAGKQVRTLQLAGLPTGLYVLRLRSGALAGVRKVVLK